jgi:sugar transferase (PEP-CTERM/EpsH1 system associated)
MMGRGGLPEILYVAHRVPFPPDKGDRIRTYQILRWLASRATVHLACLADEAVDAATSDALGRLAERVAIVPIGARSRWTGALGSLLCGRTATEGAFASRSLSALLEAWGREKQFAVTIASASSMAPYLRLPSLRATPAVIDLMDVDSQKWFDYAASSGWPRSWLYLLEGTRLRRMEQELCTWSAGLVLSSTAEETLFRETVGDGPVQAINNGVDLDYFHALDASCEPHCVFVGALDYRPNVDAACWFCREVWPSIMRHRPDATVALVGRRPAAAVQELASIPGVEVVGQVPDVRPAMSRASVVVAPLRIARGVQNKVLEGLATAKAVVASPAALCGVKARPGEHLLAATTSAEWVAAILRLFDSPELRTTLGSAGRNYVEANHRWERCLEPLGPLLSLPPIAHGDSPAFSSTMRQDPAREAALP